MEWDPHVSSRDGAGRVQLEGFGPTRNRKVVGSNPSSGSKSTGQRAFPALLTSRRQPAVIPLGWITVPQAPARFAGLEVRLADRMPVDGPPSSAPDERIS